MLLLISGTFQKTKTAIPAFDFFWGEIFYCNKTSPDFFTAFNMIIIRQVKIPEQKICKSGNEVLKGIKLFFKENLVKYEFNCRADIAVNQAGCIHIFLSRAGQAV